MRARTVAAAAAVFAAGALLEHARTRPRPPLAATPSVRPYAMRRDAFSRGVLVDLAHEQRRRPPAPPWGTWPSQAQGGQR